MNAMLGWTVQVLLGVSLLAAIAASIARWCPHRPALAHAVWLVALIKFVTPPLVYWPALSWPAAEFPAKAAPSPVVVQLDARLADHVANTPRGSLELVPQSERRNEDAATISEPSLPPAAPPLQKETAGEERLARMAPPLIAPTPAPEGTARSMSKKTFLDRPSAIAWKRFPWQSALIAFWLVGAVVAMARQAGRLIGYRRRLADCAAPPVRLREDVSTLAAAMGAPVPQICLSTSVRSPQVWCVLSPRLMWPAHWTEVGQITRCRGLIAHELAHLKRRDHWTAWVDLVAGAVWWWCPLFWYCRRRLREAAEQACDALALAVLNGGRRQYAELFLELSCLSDRPIPAAPVLGVALVDRRTFEKRLMLMLNDRVSPRVTWKGLVLVAGLALCTAPAWSFGQTGTVAPPASVAPSSPTTPPPVSPPQELPAAPSPPLTSSAPSAPGDVTPPLSSSTSELSPFPSSPQPPAFPSASPTAPPTIPERPTAAPAPPGFTEPQPTAGPSDPFGAPAQNGGEPADALQQRLARLEAAVSQLAQLIMADRAERSGQASGGKAPASTAAKAVPPRQQPAVLLPATKKATTDSARQHGRADVSNAGLESLDLVKLSTAYADALGEVKLAEANAQRLARIGEVSSAGVGQSEVEAATIAAETARRKQRVLTMIVTLALDSARSELARAVRLAEIGDASESEILAARTKVQILEAILQ